jgi:phage/plasmid-like protein (TIGR03299 family)
VSKETSRWLNTNVLIGFTEKRGHAWHYRAADQGTEPNHYPGPIPVADVKRRLFHWTAEPARVLIEDRFGVRPAEKHLGVTASDNGDILGIHTDEYEIHQFSDWLLGNVSVILDDGLAIGSAGLLRARKQAWVSIEMPDNITTPEGVEFRPNLLACSSHDASLKTRYKRVVTNVVCDNTMAAGLREDGQEHAIIHKRNSNLQLLTARAALQIVHTIADDFAAEVRKLCQATVTDRTWTAFLDAHTPIPDESGRKRTNAANTRSALTRLWTSDSRVSPWKNTAWGVVQAVNTHTHHEAVIRGATRAERNMTRVIKGDLAKLDRATTATLHKVLAAI